MAPESQINHVIVEITMDATETDPKFVVEKVTAQPGRCFEGAENLLRARFECLCCKTGYVVLPLIMQTAPTRTEMEVSVAENESTPIQQVVEHANEGEKGSTVDEVVDYLKEPRQGDAFDDFKMEAELLLPEESFEMAPMENQAHADQVTDLEGLPPKRPLREVVGFDEKKQTDGREDSEMETDLTLSMDVDPDSVERPPVEHQARAEQTSESEKSDVLSPSEERSLKLQCLQSKVVVRLVRVDEEARETDASVAPTGRQEPNVEGGGFYTCDICKASMKFRSYLIRHMDIHLGIRFSCSECQASFNSQSGLIQHKKRLHKSELRFCEVCGRSQTWTKAEYYSHLRDRHPEFRIKKRQPKAENFSGADFSCVYCEPKSSFTSFEKLQEHLGDTHDRIFTCTHCPKAFTQKSNLNRHIESVHNMKTFKCPNCDKVFTWKTHLHTHLRTHK